MSDEFPEWTVPQSRLAEGQISIRRLKNPDWSHMNSRLVGDVFQIRRNASNTVFTILESWNFRLAGRDADSGDHRPEAVRKDDSGSEIHFRQATILHATTLPPARQRSPTRRGLQEGMSQALTGDLAEESGTDVVRPAPKARGHPLPIPQKTSSLGGGHFCMPTGVIIGCLLTIRRGQIHRMVGHNSGGTEGQGVLGDRSPTETPRMQPFDFFSRPPRRDLRDASRCPAAWRATEVPTTANSTALVPSFLP